MQDEQHQIEATGEDITALNDELIDKLRILNFERQYLQKAGGKSLNVASFAFSTNPAEQFSSFKNLVKWLFQLNDLNSSEFSKYDDPMTVSTNIINECKKLQIPCEFPPLKLKSGTGEQVLVILNHLASKALKKKGFTFKRPKYEDPRQQDAEADQEDSKVDEGDEIIDDAEMGEEEDFDEREGMGGIATVDQDKQIIHSVINENDWKLQCERVAGKLKVQSKADNKEWRAHIDSTKNCTGMIKKSFPNARQILEKLNDELSRSLEKIEKSERMINSNMSDIGQQYKSQSQELTKLSAHYTNLSTSLKEMNENYRTVGQKLEQIQAKTTEHSGNMTDNSPVSKIKEAVIKILAEIKSMDVRTGVLSHTILQYKTKERTQDRRAVKQLDAEDLYDFE